MITYWAADHASGDLIRFDLAESLNATTVQISLTFTLFGANTLGAVEWVTVGATEYLLALEYRTSGTPYLYVIDRDDVIDGATFDVADRIKRIEVPQYSRGIAVDADGMLWLSVGSPTTDGLLYQLDLEAALASSSDGESYEDYVVPSVIGPLVGPSQFLGDLDFDASGRLWCPTEGVSAAGDDLAFLALWSSDLSFAEPNIYQLRYDGAGSVAIKINDKAFAVKSWTPSVTPGAVSIGGPPAASAGQTNGFACARVRNVLLQESDLDIFDPFGGTPYSSVMVSAWELPILNAGAEDGDDDWAVESESLTILPGSSDIPAKFGTQYFSGAPGTEGVLVDFTCGDQAASGGVITIPAIAGGQAGDVQVIFIEWSGTPTVFPTPDDNGWRPLFTGGAGFTSAQTFFHTSLTPIGAADAAAYWRVLSGAASTFVITGTGRAVYSQLLLRGLDADNYIYGLFNGGAKINFASSRHAINPAYGVEANVGDIVATYTTNEDAVTSGTVPTVSGDVLAACSQLAAASVAHQAVVVTRHEALANNLLPYSESLDAASWSFQNVTCTLNTTSGARRQKVQLSCSSTAVTRSKAWCTVPLVAGRLYSFMVHWRTDASFPMSTAIGLTYIKPSDSSEHGLILPVSTSRPAIDVYGSEVAASQASLHLTQSNGSGLTRAHSEMRFVAPETGDFEIVISLGNASGIDAIAGNTSRVIAFNGITLAELPSNHYSTPYVETVDANPVAIGDSLALMPAGVYGSSSADVYGTQLATLWKNTTGTKPLCRLCDLGALRFTHHDGFSLTSSDVLQPPLSSVEYYVGLYSSHVVHKYMAVGQQFYAEYTVDAIGTATNLSGLAVMCGIRTRSSSLPDGALAGDTIGEHLGTYAYCPNGTTYLNGVSEGTTVATVTTGDIIGVGLDLTAGEIKWYKNGTLVRTQTIANQTYQLKMPWMIATGVQSGLDETPNHHYTVNFRGPFGGRKPGGYVAFDHDNEIP